MLQITARDIVRYSSCPKKAKYLWGQPSPLEPIPNLISDVIKSAHFYYTHHGELASWKRVTGWASRLFCKNITVSGEVDYKSGERVLTRLSKWHSKYYLDKNTSPAIINVPIALALGQSCYYRDSLPMVSMDKSLKLYDFHGINEGRLTDYTGIDMYDDLLLRIRLWNFIQATDTVPSEYVRYVISKESISTVSIFPQNEFVHTSNKIIRQILQGMRDDVWYTARSSQCNTCEFRATCTL